MQLTEEDIARVLSDLLTVELSQQLGGQPLPHPMTPNSRLDEPAYNMDSIKFVQLAGAVNQQFHIHESGLEDNLLRYRSIAEWATVVTTAWQHAHARLTFRTSGTQGETKACTHLTEWLQQEISTGLAPLFADRQRIVSFVPSHHIYGFLFTVLLPKYLQIPWIDARTFSIGQLATTLRSGDLLISFPLNWAYLAESLPTLPTNLIGVTSTAPCKATLIHQLQQQGLQQMVEVYGSSETAGIGYRTDPSRPYTVFAYWQRAALADGEYGLRRLLPSGECSEVMPLMDAVVWDSECTLSPVKRHDGAVQVAGVNVFPEHVAARLQEHPQVQACAVRVWQTTTPRLKAFVVAETGVSGEDLAVTLHEWCAEHFSAPERPIHFTFGDALPRNALGKLQDW